MFIETVYCGNAGLSYITYAHNHLDRLLMTEIHIWNPENSAHVVNIHPLRLGILFTELSSSNYLQIAFIFGLQTL